ncbi:MAG: radical SAM protein [Thermodesulfobacteriota bacterium]|nr:radical SAM protein [Thermodesulfobacteriota bacterium]
MKILFIFPNANSQTGFQYGIAHISAVLKQAGHSVELLQLCEDIAPLPSENEFANMLKKADPDIIGFSVVTNQWLYAEKLASWAHKATDVPIVCGGIHALAAGEDVLNSGVFDYIIRGEAENAFLDFVTTLENQGDVSQLRNLGMVKNGKLLINPMRQLPDLKKLPFKDYEIFDFQKIIDAKNGWVGLMGSRGCPFSCTYCFNHSMVKQYRKDLNCSFKQLNYIRRFDVADIIKEIKFLINNYRNIKMFIFDDDIFTFYKDHVIEFCREYKKICSLPFTVNGHVGVFDEEMAAHLVNANCRIVKFGVESGSPRIRKMILNRHMKNESIINAIQTAKKAGLHTSVFLMIGLPDETMDDVYDTVNIMGKSRPGRFRWTFFFPFPGTKALEISKKLTGINNEKMKKMENFTEESCLDFGKEHNLFLKKIGRVMPWFVNAASNFDVSDYYREKVEEILKMEADEWDKESKNMLETDKTISKKFVNQKLSHYAIKYNPFMGVISDFFTKEE